MRKLANGALVPQDDEAKEQLKHVKVGAGVRVTLVRVRNYKFLQKFHVLVGVLFDIWCETAPRLQYKGHDVSPNKEKFRGDLVILCGYYDAVFGVRGELLVEMQHLLVERVQTLVAAVLLRERQPRPVLELLSGGEQLEIQPEALAPALFADLDIGEEFRHDFWHHL